MNNESVFDWEILNGKLLKIYITSPDIKKRGWL